MKIGLIEACDPDWQFKRFSYPLQLGYLASYLKKYDEGENGSESRIEIIITEEIDEIINAQPDLVGISSYSINYDIAVEFAKKIKNELNVPVILGGCHISALPETFKPVFDLAVSGEGEKTFRQVVDLYRKKGKFEKEDLQKIDGIVFLDGEEIVKTPPRPTFRFLDRIPHPDRSLYKIRSGHHYISTSRGCPFHCLFCAPKLMWKTSRYFTTNYVIQEIINIIGLYGTSFTNLSVVDDLFIANKKRLRMLQKWFFETGISEAIISQANVRADLIDDEMAEILSDMNFRTVNFGAESGSDKILKYYNKKTTVEDNQRAVDILYNHGVMAIPSFIIGAPVEAKEDFEATIDFIEKNHKKLAGFEIFPLIPMPGSQLWEYAKEKGIVNNNIEWARLEPLLLDFNPDSYFYMVEEVSKKTFLDYVKRFQELYAKYNPKAMEFRKMLEEMKSQNG
ncbi:MAG: B12-binding domain-containing radical SAM protein [Candidatus Eremiobacteraeota bacterium]|nr:B12-binding domain-containing radical SAM protein [Candidatus Eremiobacteraeota bacterium]